MKTEQKGTFHRLVVKGHWEKREDVSQGYEVSAHGMVSVTFMVSITQCVETREMT